MFKLLPVCLILLVCPVQAAPDINFVKKLAGKGHAEAQITLGLMYAQGKGIAEDDTLAADWPHKAAVQEHAEAQFNLGTMYSRGREVSEDVVLAAEWYLGAAQQGHAEAQYRLRTYVCRRRRGS